MEPLIKGQTISAAKEYIEEKLEPAALPKIIAALLPDHQAIFQKKMMAGSWHPEKAFAALLETAEKFYGDSSYKLCREIGAFSAHEGISRFYKIFIHFGDPAFVISRAGRFWGQIHNTGEMVGEKTGDKSGAATISGHGCPSRAFCHYLIGYMRGILEMSGAKNISVKEDYCVLDGKGSCRFSANWE